jgi:Tol biopolymer transport system component
MKKVALTLAATVLAIASTGCGTDSKSPLITYVARSNSDSWTPHVFKLTGTTGTPTAVSIPVPTAAFYVTANGDATQVIYNRDDSAGVDVYAMGKDGTEKQLTTDGQSWVPAFSPDGKTITWTDEAATGDDQIYVMNADGTNQHALYAPDVNIANAYFSQFSPDGKSVVFYVQVLSGPLVQTPQAGPTGLRHFVPSTRHRNQRAVSRSLKPQVADPASNGWYTMKLTDSAPTLVYATTNNYGPAVFTADGKNILFTDCSSTCNIVRSDLSGTATQLTTDPSTASYAAVPFKNLILFNRQNATNSSWDIYVMDGNGGNQTLVNSTANTYEFLLDSYAD